MKMKRKSKKKPTDEKILTEEEERQEHELRMKIKQSLNTQQVLRNEVEETEQHRIQLGQQRTDGIFKTAGHFGNGMLGRHPATMNASGVAGNNSQLQHQYDSRLPQHQNPSSIQEQMQEMQIRLEFQRQRLEEQIQIKRHLHQHQQMALMDRCHDTAQHFAYVEQSQSHQQPQSERQDQVNPYGCQLGAGFYQDNYQRQQMHKYLQTAHDQDLPHQNTAVTDQYHSYQTSLGDESRQSRRSIAGLDPSDSWLRSENGTSRCEMGFYDVGNMSASFSSAMGDDGEPFRSNSDSSIDTPVARNESQSIEAALKTAAAAAAVTELNPIKENEESTEEASNFSSLGQSSMTKGSLALSLLDDNDFLNVVENLTSTDSATNDALQTIDSMKMSLDSQTMRNLNVSMGDATQNERSSPSGDGTKRLSGSSKGSTGDLPKQQRSNRGSTRGREGVSSGGGKSSMMSDISQWCGSDNPFDAAASVDEVSASNGAGKCQGLELSDGARAQQANQSSSSQGSSHFGSSIQSISLSLMSVTTDDLTQSVQALDISDRSRSND
ncbi:hypothetical protein THAOC_31852 [Thalassiosira oceanica]|uniref:Uncharacterized protein n=1 Tax=Thalassiosira oceanica TaxID=159749 RepID=K0RAI3_THAOC|nr:hypothetical protein THAOC_31852 [Thalassiosira oceanica]|eukprot:EJK49294.1 hypothetical protein THAOC_31852 [Thalassiosira oceanica]